MYPVWYNFGENSTNFHFFPALAFIFGSRNDNEAVMPSGYTYKVQENIMAVLANIRDAFSAFLKCFGGFMVLKTLLQVYPELCSFHFSFSAHRTMVND